MQHEARKQNREDSTLEVTWRGSSGPWVVEIGSADGFGQSTLEPGARLVLGSSGRADVTIEDRAVSARHCALGSSEDGVVVEDLASRNGVFVGGARVTRAVLGGRHSVFVIGRTSVVVRPVRTDDCQGAVTEVPGLVGSSAPMREVARAIHRHARLKAPVLIHGESGTGKDVVAQALHRLSERSGSYVPLNMGAVSESLADAELFGHRRGAFTGAVSARPGAFELAHRGTLFLDEIAELSPALQVKLLRVVEDGIVRPLGGDPLRVETRLVSATWAELESRAHEGRFREDLLHRLSTVVIELPPLRHRKSDIPALAAVILERIENEVGPKRVSTRALARLVESEWRGNVRQLGTVLYRAAVAADGAVIDAEHIDPPTAGARRAKPLPLSPHEAIDLLQRHAGNTTRAARAAKVPRSTFRAWLAKAK